MSKQDFFARAIDASRESSKKDASDRRKRSKMVKKGEHDWQYLGGVSGMTYNVMHFACLKCGETTGPGSKTKCCGRRH